MGLTATADVRPARHIAWRSMTAADDPREALASALGQILAQPIPIAPATAGART